MAFLRYARANVVRPQVHSLEWDKVRVASGNKQLNQSLRKKAEDILGESFTPERFLLTHATIVCSVDAIAPPNTKTGSIEEDGQKINRKYADYRVSKETDKYINNNLDSWSRGVIKKSYQTFIGAHNFVEHIQVEELSKGKIIDAVLRDIGESLYVDILVATDKKHKELVEQIVSGEMNSMSMGCSVDFTICTKCGHVAADETEMCPHVKYEKGNSFFDEQGNKHRVAELCGHEDNGETGGVTFIEASWVATPAFPGAVARNTIEIEDPKEVPEKWVSKSASVVTSAFGMEEESEEESGNNAPASEESLLKKLDSVYEEAIVDRFKKKLESEIKKEKANEILNPPISKSTVEQNDTIVKEGLVSTDKYAKAISLSVKTASSIHEAVFNIALVNNHFGVQLPSSVYKIASKVGCSTKYSSVDAFLARCSSVYGKTLTEKESFALIRISKILSLKNFGQ